MTFSIDWNCRFFYNFFADKEFDVDSIVLKVFLWPRLKNCNDNREKRINAGSCELSGHIFVLDDGYDTVTETDIIQQLQQAALPAEDFENLVREVAEVLKPIDVA